MEFSINRVDYKDTPGAKVGSGAGDGDAGAGDDADGERAATNHSYFWLFLLHHLAMIVGVLQSGGEAGAYSSHSKQARC